MRQSYGYLIILLASEMRLSLDRLLKPYGITSHQLIILLLCGASQDTTPVMLSEALRITPSAVTRLLERLEASGFVKRKPSKRDRRMIQRFTNYDP